MVITIAGAFIIVRLFILMVLDHSFYKSMAANSQEVISKLIPKRGSIYMQDSRNGEEYPLVINRDFFTIFADTREIKDDKTAENIAEKLAQIFNYDDEKKLAVYFNLNKRTDPYEPIEKKFLIIGNTNALTYKDIFKLVKDNKIRTGYTNFNVGMFFEVPKEWEKYHHIDESGKKIARVSTSCWFTNLEVEKHKQDIVLYKKYNEVDYPNYENYKAIDISKVQEIPMDYKKEMGVPITFVDKYSPDQFEMIALGIVGSITFTKNKKMEILKEGKPTGKFTVNAKGTLYRKYKTERDDYPAFRDVETDDLYSSIYARIIIKNKKPQK